MRIYALIAWLLTLGFFVFLGFFDKTSPRETLIPAIPLLSLLGAVFWIKMNISVVNNSVEMNLSFPPFYYRDLRPIKFDQIKKIGYVKGAWIILWEDNGKLNKRIILDTMANGINKKMKEIKSKSRIEKV